MTRMVAAALAGAAAGGTPSGTSVNMPKMIGMTVTGISMITVPATVGVKIRRSRDSRAESANWPREETTIRGRQQRRPAFGERRHAYRDEGPGGAHEEDVSGADAPDPHRLQHRGQPTDRERREDRPRQVGLALARGPDHDDRGEHHARDAQRRVLEAEAEGERVRRLLVGLVTQRLVRVGVFGLHSGAPCGSSRARDVRASGRDGGLPANRKGTGTHRANASTRRRPGARPIRTIVGSRFSGSWTRMDAIGDPHRHAPPSPVPEDCVA